MTGGTIYSSTGALFAALRRARPALLRHSRRRQATALIESFRGIGALFFLANLAIAVPYLMVGSTAQRFGGALTAAALVVCVGSSYRSGRFVALHDAAVVVALSGLAYWLAAPPRALGLLLAFTLLRSLYGTGREVSAATAGAACGFVLAILGTGGRWAAVADVVPLIALGALAAPLANHFWRSISRFQERSDREHALALAAAQLRTAAGPASVAEIIWRAAGRIARSDAAAGVTGGGELLFWNPRSSDLQASANRLWESIPLKPANVPETHTRLTVRDAVLAPRRSGEPPALVVPICAHGTISGLIAVASPEGGEEAVETLTALSAEASLALDHAAVAGAATQRERQAHALLRNSPDLIATVDTHGTITYASSAVARMLGYAPARVTGLPFETLLEPADAADWRALLRLVAQGTREAIELRLRRRDGEARHAEIIASNLLHDGVADSIMLTVRDVTDRKATVDQLIHSAYHDALTGLPNRELFLERTRDMLSRARRRDSVAVLFIDLDEFKAVNDQHSHAAGDELLRQIAGRLQEGLRPTDIAARLSGDEFAILLGHLGDGAEAERIARRLLEAITQRCQVGQQTVRVGASIGVAVGGTGVEEAEDLLHRADLAMYAAKRRSGDTIDVRLPQDHERPDRRARLVSELPEAITGKNLQIRYQPIVSLADDQVVAGEALVRWQHREWGLLPPAALVPLAEEAGLMAELFTAILTAACADAGLWTPAGEALPVTVNLSTGQLRRPDLAAGVEEALAGRGFLADRLMLEVPQDALLQDPPAAERAVRELKQIGVRIAIDGFDAHHPPIGLMRRLEMDAIKLAAGQLSASPKHRAQAGLIRLAQGLGVPTIATGVERAHQRDELRSLGCDCAQGHLFSRPLSGRAFAALLEGPARLPSGATPAVAERGAAFQAALPAGI